MRNIYLSSLALIFSLGFVQQSFGQLKLSGELRPRPEYQNGYKTLRNDGDNAVSFVSQRTRVNLDYQMELLKFGVKFQDVRVWGSSPQLNSSDAYLALHEAWAEVLFTEKFSLKLGRQEVAYDDHRILGNVGWAQQARSHDLGIFKYESDFKLHVGIAYSQTKPATFPDYTKYYKTMQFVWFHKDLDNLKISALFLNNGLQKYDVATSLLTDEINYGQTLGTFVQTNFAGFTIDGSIYYQMGTDRYEIPISAYNIAVHAKFNLTEAISLNAGAELLSGTDDLETDNNNSFNPLYGTNHKFNGFMDYFYVGGGHIDNVGLNDFIVGAKWKTGKWSVGGTVHYFMSNADLYDFTNSEVVSSGLGTEIDMSAGYKFNDWINFTAGYSQMFATSSMEVLKGGNKDITNNWAYLMIVFKPTFLDTNK